MFKTRIAQLLAGALTEEGIDAEEIKLLLEIPPNPTLGDYALPCFGLAKRLRMAPNKIAAQLAEAIAEDAWLAKVEVVGGYLNLFLEPSCYIAEVLGAVLTQGNRYGSGEEEGNIVIDFSSPNIAKPFSIGHLPSTVIGHSLARIYRHLGFNVVRINHLGDLGTQFGKLMVAYHRWGEDQAIETKGIKELLRLYVKYHQVAEEDPELDNEARAWFKGLEDGDAEAVRLWEWFRALSLQEFERVYRRMGIEFDSYLGESFYNDKMDEVLKTIIEAGIATASEGALVVDVGDDIPPCLLKKSDGATLYATRDITAAIYRWNQWKFVKSLYVVGVTQSLHFDQVFRVLNLLGHHWAQRCQHVPFGTILFGDEAMSTRRGNVIFLEDVLEEAVTRIRTVIAARNPDLADPDGVAEQVGIGAVIFNALAHSRIKDTEFDWEKVISLEGDTGPYVQYAYARGRSVLAKAEETDEAGFAPQALTDPEALAVIRLLERFPEVVRGAAEKDEPSLIARYCLDLAAAFNTFYHARRILGVDDTTQTARLALVRGVCQVLEIGLYLLGLEAPEEM